MGGRGSCRAAFVVLGILLFLHGCSPNPSSTPRASRPLRNPSNRPDIRVYFSPRGGCTEAIIEAMENATRSIRVQAYSFTSAPIAKALREAKRRGLDVEIVLDDSNQTAKYSAATFTSNSGIPTFIDAEHSIAHNKVIIVDDSTVITGSFNFTKAAEQRNAENVLIIRNAPDLARDYLENYREHRAHSSPYQRRSG